VKHIRIFNHYISSHHLVLGLVEFLLLVAAVYAGSALRFVLVGDHTLSSPFWDGLLVRASIFSVIMIICMVAMGVYQSRAHEGLTGMTLRTVVAFFLLGSLAVSFFLYLAPDVELNLGRGVLALTCVVGLILVTAFRWMFFRSVSEETLKKRILFVGAGERASRLCQNLTEIIGNFHIVGFVPVAGSSVVVGGPLVTLPGKHLLKYAVDQGVDEIVVAVDDRRRSVADQSGFPLDDLLDCKLGGVAVIDEQGFYEREAKKINVRTLNPSWLVFSDGFSYSASRDYIQRAFDIIASSLLIMVSWPFMLLAVIAIKIEEGPRAPLIYSQERVGLNGRTFKVHKFRSMRVDAEKHGAVWAKKNDDRVTLVGKFIRNTRIDELPQIFNVFRGDMSFVGPRPERPQFVEQLNQKIPFFNERHRVKPGITGWAQLCYPYGASDEDSEQKLQYDLYYIKNRSLLLDLIILVRTVEVILIGKGVR
jgi:sugar transferase (PEP-CTERM system associated)